MNPLILNIPIIGITGSTGKSTTTRFISSILETKWKVFKRTDNLNLPIHTSYTIRRFNPSFQAIVLELAIAKPGDLEEHCRYIQPNISVITNVGTAHFGSLGNNIQSTAANKSGLIKFMNPKGKLLINKDDENSRLLETEEFNGEIITVGIKYNPDYRASNIEYSANGMSFEVILDNKIEQFYIPTFGEHNVYNALFAIAICHRLSFTPSEISYGLENCKIPERRLSLFNLGNQSLLIDDTYNANPQSVKAAIDVLVQLGKDKKKIVVLGNMLELGEYSVQGHKEVGRYLAENKIDSIYTYGKVAKWILQGAFDSSYPVNDVHHFEDRASLHRSLSNLLEGNSVILVKGSGHTQMSQTARYIKDHFSK